MLELEIAKNFERRFKQSVYYSKSLVRLKPAELDLVLIDRVTHELINYEFKRRDWKKTFFQALRNQLYCHYCYVVVPTTELSHLNEEPFLKHGIGLIVYNLSGTRLKFDEVLKPSRSSKINRSLKKQIYRKFELQFSRSL